VAGDVVYFMLPVRDAERAQAFFGRLFGWGFEPGSVPGGFNVTGSTPPGGLYGGQEPAKPEVWFQVDDMDSAVAQIRELGGEADDPEDIESGRMASCRDDQGTPFNIWAGRA
jgi:predicted enzyme related to lactoylglutathione lyase